MSESTSPESHVQLQCLDIVSEAISGAFLIYDRNDSIIFASPQLRNFLPALPVVPARGTRLRDFFGIIYDHGGYFPTQGEKGRRVAVSREDWITGEIATLWKERSETVERRGSDRWMSLTKRRLPSGYGVCFIRDVSEHRKREDQWRADLERVQVTEEILDNLPFPVMVKDRNLSYVAVNKAACSLYSMPLDVILGRNVHDLHTPELAQRIERTNRQVLETGTPFHVAESVIRPNGTKTAIITRKFRVGKPGRYFVVTSMEDLSDVIGTGLQPERLLTGVEGLDFVHSDMRGTDAGAARAIVSDDPAVLADRKVLLVTEDALVESEGVGLLLRRGLDATAARTTEEMQAIIEIARQRNVSIDLIVIDSTMEIGCLEVAQASGVDVLVFDVFQMERDLVGNVTRQLARPSSSVQATDDDASDWQISSDATIDVLVAEDNQVNQIVFAQILEGFGYRYAIASDGEEAVRLWRELNPSIVLMDITLPGLNGFEAASRIREMEETPGRTPIIGVLSPAVEGDRDACWAAGMNDVVMKPLSPDILEETFRRFLTDMPGHGREREAG
jgi:PAS domain S-box-containing protein